MTAADPHALAAPSDWIVRWSALIPPGGTVLDVACGSGRHVRFLAGRGHRVLALDRDAGALAGVAGLPGVEVLAADIENGPWPFGGDGPAGYAGRTFDAVVVTNYLHRPLFPALAAAVAPDGVLLHETFMQGNERFGKPSNPAFLLAPGELLAAYAPALATVAFEQGRAPAPRAAMIQRLAASRRAADATFLA
jgi:SAM-dependent methyltransferase